MLYINDKRYFSSVLILVLFNIILIKLPLTSVFSYEISAFNSILLIIVAGLLVISFLKRKENFVKNILKISPILLSVPLIISVTNTLITTTCSLTDGFLFYLVITVPSIVIGSALGFASFYITHKYSRITFIFLLCIDRKSVV
jgi:hypothetical protein